MPNKESLPGQDYIDAGWNTAAIVAREGASMFILIGELAVVAFIIEIMRLFRDDPEGVAKKHMQNRGS